MALQHSVLALLADGPSHGYEVRARFDATVGGAWGPVNIGQVYQVLDRLRRDGLVTGDHVPQTGRPDRTVYSLTPAGQDELRNWLTSATVPRRGYRDEFFLKLIAVSAQGEKELLALINRQRQGLASQIRSLVEAGRSEADPFVRLLLSAAQHHAAADVHILDDAEQTARLLVERDVAGMATVKARDPAPHRSEGGRSAQV